MKPVFWLGMAVFVALCFTVIPYGVQLLIAVVALSFVGAWMLRRMKAKSKREKPRDWNDLEVAQDAYSRWLAKHQEEHPEQ